MKPKLFKNFILLQVVGFFAFPIMVWGASDFKRPIVSDCVERTGFSEEKCSEMLEKMKDGDMKERGTMRPAGPNNGQGEPPGSFNGEEGRSQGIPKGSQGKDKIIQGEKVGRIRAEEEGRFSRMEERIEKIINFLESKDINIDELKENLEIFKNKADAVLSTIDDYISILEDAQNDDSVTTEDIKEARDKIHALIEELKTFYQSTLRDNLKSKLKELE